jgi:hypothetical protein
MIKRHTIAAKPAIKERDRRDDVQMKRLQPMSISSMSKIPLPPQALPTLFSRHTQ